MLTIFLFLLIYICKPKQHQREITMNYRDELFSIFSDAYKDAYGIRPNLKDYAHFTDEALREEINYISNIVFAAYEQQEQDALRFEKHITDMLSFGANSREDAIRWILDSEGLLGEEPAYICFRFNLPDSYKEEVS